MLFAIAEDEYSYDTEPTIVSVSSIRKSLGAEVSNVTVAITAEAGLLAQRYSLPPIGLPASLTFNDVNIFDGTVIGFNLDCNTAIIRLAA